MKKNWTFEGSEKELRNLLPIEIIKDAHTGFNKYRDIFDDDEYINVKYTVKQNNIPGALNLMIPDTNYFINLKTTSIVFLAFVMDLKLTEGFASTILGMIGFSTQSIVRLDEINAEKCIFVELYRQKGHIGNSNIFSRIFEHECINNHLACKYRVGALCTIKQKDINDILISLSSKNVLEKISNNVYKCSF